MSYLCPLCHTPLNEHDRQWRCVNNHQFDRAKEGYVNLMPVQFKHSRQPGDNADMMQARRAFLDGGFYHPLRQAVCTLLDQALPTQAGQVLDIGCGEGYYTAQIASALESRSIKTFGLDIAKVAVRYAAKRYPQVSFCVASSHRLPYADASMDGVVRIYAPCRAEELARVVSAGGILVTVSPGSRHLYQLKAQVYEQVVLHAQKEEILPGFALEREETLSYVLELPGMQAVNLLQMTPFAWRAAPAVFQSLAALERFSCETDFTIRLYRRNP